MTKTKTTPRLVDPDAVQKAITSTERQLADQRELRADMLLDLADRPNDEDVHRAIAAADDAIARLEARAANLRQSMTEQGRRAARAAVMAAIEEGRGKIEQARDVAAGPLVAAAEKFDAAWAALRQAHDELYAASHQAQRLVREGLSPLTIGKNARRNPAAFAQVQHGTLVQVAEMMNSREGRELHVAEYAKHLAERFSAQIDYALAEVAKKDA